MATSSERTLDGAMQNWEQARNYWEEYRQTKPGIPRERLARKLRELVLRAPAPVWSWAFSAEPELAQGFWYSWQEYRARNLAKSLYARRDTAQELARVWLQALRVEAGLLGNCRETGDGECLVGGLARCFGGLPALIREYYVPRWCSRTTDAFGNAGLPGWNLAILGTSGNCGRRKSGSPALGVILPV